MLTKKAPSFSIGTCTVSQKAKKSLFFKEELSVIMVLLPDRQLATGEADLTKT
jgi:hypothetical protein